MEERTERVERIERPAAPPPVTPPQADRPPRPRSAPPPQKKARRRGVVVADPIADLLTRLRNGARARHDTVAVAPSSKLKIEVAKILKAEGFIQGYEVQGGTLTCRLRYVGGARISAFSDAQRISRPGRRTYAGRHDLPLVRRGLGVTIVSTSQGLMTGSEATKKGLGGELLCSVW
ncbi:MAG: 30S ribosomal protein S8 [Chloroflexi bacterium]|nr:MAG: 30S ribosomal protein S8 [Chloroflexota bacterium]